MTGVLTDVVIGVLTISSRASGIGGIGRRVVSACVGTDGQIVDIDPKEPVNMAFLLAFELTQAAPHSVCLNDVAFQKQNI